MITKKEINKNTIVTRLRGNIFGYFFRSEEFEFDSDLDQYIYVEGNNWAGRIGNCFTKKEFVNNVYDFLKQRNKMKSYYFGYIHNHGDYFWDGWVIPIVDNLQIEAKMELDAIKLAEKEVMEQLKKMADDENNPDQITLLNALKNHGSPFSTNELRAWTASEVD